MSGYQYIKKCTNLTGLAVAKTPHKTLQFLYQKIFKTLDKMPANAAYRKYTYDIISKRSKLVNETESVEDLEKKINCGQIEEVITQAENELALARKMLAYKPWEPLVQEPPHNQWKWPPVK